ncbi:hypothetical protein CC79DRAFT_817253 [Sarocladium strictum]
MESNAIPGLMYFVSGHGSLQPCNRHRPHAREIIILAHFDNQEIPKWPLFINLNTLIALLSMIQRAALLMIVAEIIGQAKWLWFADGEHPLVQLQEFHEASRSSLGALWLLFVGTVHKARMSVRIIVLLVTSITVLSFGIGPFAQQAITSKPCRRLHDAENATVPISHAAPGALEYTRFGSGSGYSTWDSDAVIKGSMLKGLTGSDDPGSLIKAYCPSGECDFPDFGAHFAYSSIGMCSRCNNLTAAVQVWDNSHIPEDRRLSEPVYILGDGSEDISGRQYISVAREHPMVSVWPSNLSFAEPLLTADFDSVAGFSFLNVSILAFSAAPCRDSKCQEREAALGGPSTNWAELDIVAVGCTLYPCLKNYRGSVRDGTLQEEVVSTQPALQDTTIMPKGHLDQNSNFTALQEPCVSDDGTWYTAQNISEFPIHGRNLVNISMGSDVIEAPEDCVYSVRGDYSLALRHTLKGILNGTCAGDSVHPDLTIVEGKPHCGDTWWLGPFYHNGRPDVESISRRIESLATAITNEFRRNGPVKGRLGYGNLSLPREAPGQQFESTICTTFDWPWLLAPAVLTVITALLLAWVLVQNKFRETRQPVWKGSILPFLYYGLNSREVPGSSHMQSEDFRLADLKDVNERSRRTRVLFSTGVDGGSLGFLVRDDSIEVGQK